VWGRAAGLVLVALTLVEASAAQRPPERGLAAKIQQLTRSSQWTLEREVPLAFRTHHPQGLVKIGDTFFVSSVEIRVPTRRSATRDDGFDRDAGEGTGHLFKLTSAGVLVQDLVLGEGAMYHPSGIDYDGASIWVALAEYRPNSRSIVYRVDPETMKATEVFRFDDHLGGIVRNTDDNTLHAVSWGSRWFYRWTLDKSGRPTDLGRPRDARRTANPSHYVDYQDCKYVGERRMLCTGVAELARGGRGDSIHLGGVDMIDLQTGGPVHQVPVGLMTSEGASLTRNPSFLEVAGDEIRGYFLPDDDTSTLYVYRVFPSANPRQK
jgi:hypothetical protein